MTMSNYKIKDLPITERPRERLKQVGAKYLTDKELLAIILKTGAKGKNASELALDILKQYKLEELKEISQYDLMKIKGIGEVKSLELLASIELGKRMILKKEWTKKQKMTSPQEIWSYSKYWFSNLKQEQFYCLYFNHKQELIERKLLFMGTINQSITHPREIFKEAYRLSASSIVCLHNHPSNDINPSRADIIFTEKLMKAGTIQGIPIIDHIIVGEDSFYSFYEHRNILNLDL